ncbi:pectinesterase PPME1-like [Andrographis paniculata]|uniref:pectinesterase PPME1-like n=1 Tax=Andrographis paniculata TaxID=175694 RepID=UPI0021E8BD2B|nr:pectinesterase PPME1-like [Andrographis paniculata]
MATAGGLPYILFPIMAAAFLIPAVEPKVPNEGSKLDTWFNKFVGTFESRKKQLLPELVAAETSRKVITVRQDGKGQFRSIKDAINSIPDGNKDRIIVAVGPGTYVEKVTIYKEKPFVTLYGDPKDMPMIVYNETARSAHGTVYSGTVMVLANHFSAVNMKFKNSAPKPDGNPDEQALALRISGDYASFYNCKFYGFQDTLMDDHGRHLYKDCYIEGTVDFVFGTGQTIFMRTELHVIGDGEAFVAAHGRNTSDDPSGFVFLLCSVTGTGKGNAYLGRPWFDYARIIFLYSEMDSVINPAGWYNNKPTLSIDSNAYFAERQNRGPGANHGRRGPGVGVLPPGEVGNFANFPYVEAEKWLLPPTSDVS